MLLFPPRQDAEASLRAYIDETADIPLPWLLEGLRGFRDEPERVFLPSISEVRTACAKSVRRARLNARGESEHSVTSQARLDVGGILRWAVENVPLGHAQLEAVCGEDRDRRAIEAENREAVQAEDLTPHQQRSELTRLTLKHIEDLIAADGLTGQLNRRQHERAREHRRTG